MNRIRIHCRITHKCDQIIELSDQELQEFRNKDITVDDFLDEALGNGEIVDWELSAKLVDENDFTIESLDT